MPLFDWGGLRLEDAALHLLQNHQSSLGRLNDLMLQLLRQPSTETGHSDLLSKQGVCELMLQRLDVLLWFCTVKLLPEVSRELVCFDFGNVNNGVTCFCFDFILKMY